MSKNSKIRKIRAEIAKLEKLVYTCFTLEQSLKLEFKLQYLYAKLAELNELS